MQVTWLTFALITVLLGGGAAWMTGRAVAQSWQPMWLALAYCVPLALAVRFFHYALAHEELISPLDLGIEFVVLALVAATSHQVATTSLKVRQYPWLYRRTSPLTTANVSDT